MRSRLIRYGIFVTRFARYYGDHRQISATYYRQCKPRPHQLQRRSNIVECQTSNDSFDKVETNCTCSVQFVSNLSKGRNFTIELFEALLPFVATKSNVASTLLLVYSGFT